IAVLYWDITSRIKNNQNIQDLQTFYQDDLDVGHHKGYNIAVRESFGLISHEEATTIVNLYDALNQSCYYYLAYLLLKKDNNQFASALLYENFLTPQWWAGFSFLAALEEMKELDIDIISIKNKYEKYAGRIFKDKNADRRQEKTLNVVYNAFTYLLKRKKYSDISINDILLESNVSRSTFYSYFKKKEDLLESICNLIFDHVFSHDLSKEKSHSFTDDHDKVHIITHILYHFLDERDLFDAISINESKYIFEQYLKERYMDTAKRALDSHLIKRKDVPEELQLQEIINNFILVLEYWQNSNYQESPENVTTYYLKICS
ncbi:MAG: TetR/AcrR family transcriptional regulator, partial [Bacilli bacterium]|nr:TetR/AcrR family transcriptional regulator [Bacilli bacterium]